MSAFQLEEAFQREEAFQLKEALAERQSNLLFRLRHVIDSPQGPEVILNGKSCLAFCSNDYLGLANHPEVISHFQKAASQYGVGGGSSHLIVGHSRPHHRLEELLAEFTGRPRALLFSTGYMANLGVISTLLGNSDAVFQDRLNHASLLDAGTLSGARMMRYRHSDLSDLEKRLEKTSAKRKLIVTDGVFSMDGDLADLRGLANLASQYNGWLMVDDAHGFGCLGLGGRGSASQWQLSMNELPVLVGTLGKAFGTSGAFVAGSEVLIETLIQFARPYIYTTAMPPAIAEATCTSLRLLEAEDWRREQLSDLITYFRNGCEALNLPIIKSSTPIQPIMVGDIRQTLMIGEKLLAKGILITPIRPPTVPKGEARLRVTLSASHTLKHVDRLLDALSDISGLLKQDAA